MQGLYAAAVGDIANLWHSVCRCIWYFQPQFDFSSFVSVCDVSRTLCRFIYFAPVPINTLILSFDSI